MLTIAFTNQKGGTGKTTSAVNTAAALHNHGYKVLLIDLDPQGNATTSAGIVPDENEATVYEVLKGTAKAADAIRSTAGGYDILPTDIRQSSADIELASAAGRDFILKEALDTIKNRYDFAIIDNPPNLSIITLMALTAADGIIITLKSDYLALNGVAQLKNTITLIKRRLNPNIEITGILLTFFDGRKNLDSLIAAQAEEGFPGKVFSTRISQAVALAEAPAAGRDIFKYKPTSKAAAQYEALTEEILARINQ